MREQKFNIIGFDFQRYSLIPREKYKHCIIHPAIRVISKPNDPGVLYCPMCGTTYQEKDISTEETVKAKFNPKQQTKIITPKKKKKYYDKQGNEINDETLLKDIANGANVISYYEQKSGEERHFVQR